MTNISEAIMNKQEKTIIGPSARIDGSLDSEENIRIEGQINGKVISRQNVVIDKSAKFAADIAANEVDIAGEVHGKLEISGHLILRSNAKVSGEIICPVLRVEDGATIAGMCIISGKK